MKILKFKLISILIILIIRLNLIYLYNGQAVSAQKKNPPSKVSNSTKYTKLSRGEVTSITVRASANCLGSRTALGTKPRRNSKEINTIAVDPNIISLRTKVYVEGYGLAIAEDVGRSIKCNRIDVYFTSKKACLNWGNAVCQSFFGKLKSGQLKLP